MKYWCRPSRLSDDSTVNVCKTPIHSASSNVSATGVHVGGKLCYIHQEMWDVSRYPGSYVFHAYLWWECCWYTYVSYKHVGWYSRPEEAEHYEYRLFQTLQYQRCITLRHINICSWHCICISVEFPPFTHTHAQRHKHAHAHTCTCTHTHTHRALMTKLGTSPPTSVRTKQDAWLCTESQKTCSIYVTSAYVA